MAKWFLVACPRREYYGIILGRAKDDETHHSYEASRGAISHVCRIGQVRQAGRRHALLESCSCGSLAVRSSMIDLV